MAKLTGKVALVTGSGRGLGRAYALRLAGLGADVVISDVNLESAKEFDEQLTADTVMDEVHSLGCRSIGVQADVSNRSEVDEMFEQILEEFGQIDILVNNAGGGLKLAGDPTGDEQFAYTMQINLMSAVYCCQAASVPMKNQKNGKIINISSLAGLRAGDGGPPYSIAKAGITQYTKVLALELGPFGINVNCIAPSYILTSRKVADGMDQNSELIENIALRRLGTPEDCAKVIEFLATDLSDYVSGQCIPVCGGVMI